MIWNRIIGYRDGKTRWFRFFFPHYQMILAHHREMGWARATFRWLCFLFVGICGSCEGKRRIFYTTSNVQFEVHCSACKGTFKRGNFFNEFEI